MPFNLQLLLLLRQTRTCSNPQLPLHQIHACDRFRHRMFNLQARVHFHEPKTVLAQTIRTVHDKLYRSRTRVPDRFCSAHSSLAHSCTHRVVHAGCRCFFNHLLVAPLKRTIALEQMHRVRAIPKHLDFYMTRFRYEFLNKDVRISKSLFGFRTRAFKCGSKSPLTFDEAHAFATATSDCFDQYRIPNLGRFFSQQTIVLIRTMVPRYDRHTGLFHQ